jgi:glycosyltransferase involved in cell wall biosynthesis
MSQPSTLSVIINTKNAAKTIETTLKSVKFADEIVIVDMHSTDETVKVALKYTKKVFTFDDVGYVEPARNFAINKATGDWLLIVDADEELPTQLKPLIMEILQGQSNVDCYYLPRKNMIFGTWVRKTGWWPDYQLRLFRRGHVEWSDEIHSIPITTGRVAELPAEKKLALVHQNYQTIEQFIDRLNRYTTFEAAEKTRKTTNPAEVMESFNDELFRRLFAQQGIDEGMHGIGLSLLQTFYQVAVQLKIWQKNGFPAIADHQPEVIANFRSLQKGLNYWIADWQVQHSSGFKRIYWQLRRKLMM